MVNSDDVDIVLALQPLNFRVVNILTGRSDVVAVVVVVVGTEGNCRKAPGEVILGLCGEGVLTDGNASMYAPLRVGIRAVGVAGLIIGRNSGGAFTGETALIPPRGELLVG